MKLLNRRVKIISSVLPIILVNVVMIYAQREYDREFRVHESSIHPAALTFIDSCNLTGTVKWYKEYHLNEVWLEAKTRKHRKEYSIEFDTLGVIKDVELTIQFEDIPDLPKTVIRNHLSSLFSKYRILKTQFQWSGEPQALLKLIRHQYTNQPYTTHYEIILIGKGRSNRKAYELLYDRRGAIVEFEEIPSRNTDHLDY